MGRRLFRPNPKLGLQLSRQEQRTTWFRRVWELGVSECQLKRGGSEIVSAKRNRRVRFSG